MSRFDDDYFYSDYSYRPAAEKKVTGEVLAAIHLTDENRDELMRLAKNHFSVGGVLGANNDVVELKFKPNWRMVGLFNTKGGSGTVEVIPQGRERTPGLQMF